MHSIHEVGHSFFRVHVFIIIILQLQLGWRSRLKGKSNDDEVMNCNKKGKDEEIDVTGNVCEDRDGKKFFIK